MRKSQFIVSLTIVLALSACDLMPVSQDSPTASENETVDMGSLPSQTPLPLPSPTTTPTPFPINAEVMDQAVVLEVPSLDLIESLVLLWPSQPLVSDLAVLPNHPSIIVIGYGEPSGRLNSAPGGHPQLVFWNIETNTPIFTVESESEGIFFSSIVVSPDGNLIAYLGTDRILLVTLESGASLNELTFTRQEFVDSDTNSMGFALGAAFSPDGRLLAIMADDGTILLWDVQAGRTWTELSMTGQVVNDCGYGASCIAFTPDGHSLLAARGHDLRIWNLDDLNNPINILLVREVTALTVTPDGRFALTGNDIGEIHVWDLADGTLRFTESGHRNGVDTLLISPDGNLLVSSSYDGVRLWDATSWTILSTIDSRFYRIGFTSDGRFLVSSAIEDRGRLWGVRSDSLSAERQGVKVIALPGPVYLESWAREVPAVWLAPAGQLARHEIRLESSWKVIESCAYSGGGFSGYVARQQRLVTANLLDLQTDAILATRVFEGSLPKACPSTQVFSPFDSTLSLDGDAPDADQFLSWLRSVMDPLGYP
ncbi:MAG TPA: hypothetical protein PK152_08090 [Anaerolineales bacterium]|nr:hypothetical protein [Anaerolineales bacterium]HRK89080.1 hypothetical protein [Anaerolineales bacterium]